MKDKVGGLFRSLRAKMGGGQSRQDTRKVPAGAPASETNDENVVNTMSSNSKNQQRRPRQSQSQVSAATSRLVTRKEIAYVELLKRPGQALGLVVSGGSDKASLVKVGGLRSGGLAQKSESLEVGDRILAINGKSTDNLTHSEVISLLKNAEDVITLEIEYETAGETSHDEDVITKTVLVCLKKEGNTFGFMFSGGSEKGRPLTISNVRPGTAAYRNGTLRPGDRMLKVNGMNLRHATHAEVLALLKSAKRKITLELEYDVTLHENLDEIQGPILVEVQKPVGGSLGLTLTGNQIVGEPIFISHIKDAGIADRCGALHVGDQVLSINGQSLTEWSLPDAVQMLVDSDTTLKLEVLPVSLLPPNFLPSNLGVEKSPKGRDFSDVPPTSQLHQRRPSVTSLSEGPTPAQGHSRRPSIGSLNGSMLALANPMHLCHTEQLHVELVPDSFGYGFLMQGIHKLSVGPFTVASIELDSPAQQHGEFMIGDRILAINGRSTEGMLLEQAWNVVNEATGNLALQLEFDVAESVIPGTGTFDVKLAKHSGGLGITINGNPEKGGPIWISQIKKGGIAHRTGTLEPGDVLLAIDGKNLEGATLQHAVELLKSSGDVVTLQISKDTATLGPPGTIVFTVELMRRGASLGITVHGSENPGDPIIVSQLREDGVAFRSGTLKVGDRILAINNVNLRMHTLVDAVKLLQTAGDMVTLKICREPTTAPNRFVKFVPANSHPLIHSPKAYSQGHLNEFTWPTSDPQDDFESEVFEDQNEDTREKSTTSNRSMQRRLAMLALKQSGRSTPDMQSTAGSPQFDEMYQAKPWSTSEVANESYVGPAIEHRDSFRSYPSVQRWLRSSAGNLTSAHLRHLGSGGDSSSPGTDHRWTQTMPRQGNEWVGQVTSGSKPRYNIRDGYATWSGRRRGGSSPAGGSWSQGINDAEKRFGELRPLNPAFAAETSRRRRTLHKETSSDSDSPPSNSRTREQKRSPPKFGQRFDEQFRVAASKPTAVLVKKVTLRRKSSLSDFGFSVADGATEPGVFVKAVKPGGPAIEKLQAFDKILQVNDTNVHDSDCCRVVPLIAQASHTLSLIITRRKQSHPALTKDSD